MPLQPFPTKAHQTFITTHNHFLLIFSSMKTSNLFRLAILSIFSVVALSMPTFAAEKKESVKVWGNCGMCKKTIDGALKGVDGVSSASWNKSTKMLDVTYDDSKISMKKIEEKVAASGYDTQNVKGADAAYDGLKKCCKYERKKS